MLAWPRTSATRLRFPLRFPYRSTHRRRLQPSFPPNRPPVLSPSSPLERGGETRGPRRRAYRQSPKSQGPHILLFWDLRLIAASSTRISKPSEFQQQVPTH